MKSPNFQLSLQTSNLIIGFMVWVILSSLMPYIKADIPLTLGTNFYGHSSTCYFRLYSSYSNWLLDESFRTRKLFFISFILLLFPVFILVLPIL